MHFCGTQLGGKEGTVKLEMERIRQDTNGKTHRKRVIPKAKISKSTTQKIREVVKKSTQTRPRFSVQCQLGHSNIKASQKEEAAKSSGRKDILQESGKRQMKKSRRKKSNKRQI